MRFSTFKKEDFKELLFRLILIKEILVFFGGFAKIYFYSIFS